MRAKILLGTGCFLIVGIFFFPYYGIRNRVFNEISKQTGMEIFAGKMWPTFAGMGVGIKDLTLQLPARGANNENVDVELTQVKAYVPWTSLILFSPALQVNGKLSPKGELSLWVKPKGDGFDLKVFLKNVDIGPYLEKLGVNQVNLAGEVQMDLTTHLNQKTNALGATDMKLQVQKITLDALEVAGFNIPQLKFKFPALISGVSKDGKMFDVTVDLGKSGDPFVLTATGNVEVNAKNPEGSIFDLKNSITFSKELIQNETIGMVLPLLEQFKKSDDNYHIKLTGTLGKGIDFPTTF